MDIPFAILAALTLTAAIGAVCLRSLIHCALCLALALGGVAALYLKLGAQFVGFAQALVYIGAVTILVVFAILLTRGDEIAGKERFSPSPFWGVGVAVLVFATLAGSVLKSSIGQAAPSGAVATSSAPVGSVQQIGNKLMTDFVLPLEVVGLLLTVALIGAVIIAMREKAQ